ncbi:MAG: hypothetical protein DCO96_07815 [Fluviicola sp. XM-24bin1]|nr:MAG: hypothetical protein DCO96_07815 [Fluviicola sp. XM-24bin1]
MEVIILEDEPLIAYSIQNTLKKFGVNHCSLHNTLSSALFNIQARSFDAAIIDIQINGKADGFVFADHCQEKSIPIIFLTSFGDEKTITQAIQYGPAGYLNKPYKEADINALVKILLKKKQDGFVIIMDGKKEIRIELDSILFLEANTPYVKIHTDSGTISVRKSLTYLVELLSEFISIKRVHKKNAVCLDKVKLKTRSYWMVNGLKLPISKKYTQQ